MDKEIYDLLRKTLAEKNRVQLHNLYKGVPITNDAEVLGVEEDSVHLRVSQYQVTCIYLERGTYIKGQGFPVPFRAQLSKINLERGDVTLTNVVKTQGGIGQRGQIRVEPQDLIWVSLQMKNSLTAVNTRMADLSITGLCVTMERFYFQPHIYRVGAELKVTFDLPISTGGGGLPGLDLPKPVTGSLENRFGADQLLENAGEVPADPRPEIPSGAKEGTIRISSGAVVVHFRPELYLNRYRIGLRLINDDASRRLLWEYISRRQAELIREFHQLYESMMMKRPARLT